MIAKLGGEWWTDFFSGSCLEYVRGARDEEQTRAELGFIRGAMGLPTRARVLDVPCGAGRLALEMAAWGYDVTAVDQSAELIEAARRDASERELVVDWRQGDMRLLSEDGSYDGAVCFWNSFGYFDDADNLEFLRCGIAEPEAGRPAGPGHAAAGDAAAGRGAGTPSMGKGRGVAGARGARL